MSGCNKSPKNDQHSNKYRWIQHQGTSFKADLSHVDCSPSLTSNENKQCYKNSQLKSPEILSTTQLISSIGQIWDSVSRPLSFLLAEENTNRDDKGFPKEKILGCIDEKRNDAFISNNTNYHPVNLGATGFGSQIVREKLDFPKVTQKMLILESSNGSQDYIHCLFQRFLRSSNMNSKEYHKEKELGNEEISFRYSNVYRWTSRNAPNELNCLANCLAKDTGPKNLKASSLVARDCISIDTSTTASANESDACSPDVIIHEATPLSNDAVLNTKKADPLRSNCVLQAVPDNPVDVAACEALSSSIYADSLATCHGASVQCQHKIDDNEIMETQGRRLSDLTENEHKIFYATHPKPSHSLAKQEHAFSGALAGLCVSLCLHPVDTIKTVGQSCRVDQRSIFHIGKSIVSDRGLVLNRNHILARCLCITFPFELVPPLDSFYIRVYGLISGFPGLYRGITTNIACSAPISAVYTFTYESVKSALLPYLPKVACLSLYST